MYWCAYVCGMSTELYTKRMYLIKTRRTRIIAPLNCLMSPCPADHYRIRYRCCNFLFHVVLPSLMCCSKCCPTPYPTATTSYPFAQPLNAHIRWCTFLSFILSLSVESDKYFPKPQYLNGQYR